VYDCAGQGNDSELIPTVDMETMYVVDGYFGSKFPAIITKLWRPKVARL